MKRRKHLQNASVAQRSKNTSLVHHERVKVFQIILALSVLLIVTCVAFSPSFNSGFINWDDNEYVTQNIVIRKLSLNNLKDMWSSFYVGCYLPLTMMSYALDFYFFKLDPRAFHATNVILHLFNCLLVFWLIFLLNRNVSFAFIVALFFGVHPLHVESVTWIAERKDVLYAFFFLGSLISYIYYRKSGLLKYYLFSIIIFLLSLLSKPMAVTLPFVLVLYDYLSERKIEKAAVLDKCPFLVLAVIFGIVAVFGQKYVGATSSEYSLSVWKNMLAASHGVVLYLVKTAVPSNLAAIYPYPRNIVASCFFSPFILIAIAALVLFSARYTRKIVFGSLFFFITILPVLKLVPIGYAIIADRYMYVPAIGLFYVVVEAVVCLWRTRLGRARELKHVLCVICAVVIGVLSFLTWHRCQVWRTPLTLWNDTIEGNPNIPPVAYNNRGEVYRSMGMSANAIADFTEAIARNPRYAAAYLNRGTVYHESGDFERAMADYTSSLLIDPNCVQVYNNRGNLHQRLGNITEAISDYSMAIAIAPNFPDAYNGRGLANFRAENYRDALSDYTMAVTINPYHAMAYSNRGLVYQAIRDYDKAVSDFTQALTLSPGSADVYYNRAVAYLQKGDNYHAWQDIEQAKAMGLVIRPEVLESFRKAFESGM